MLLHHSWPSFASLRFFRVFRLPDLFQQIGAFLRIAERFTLVARQLYAVVPLAFLCNSAFGEFHHDVHRLATHNVAREERAHAIAILHAPVYKTVYL